MGTNDFVIQFVELEDLLEEIRDRLGLDSFLAPVRLETLLTERGKGVHVWWADYGVHVRAIFGNTILTWYHRAASVQMLHDKPFNPDQTLEAARDRALEVENEVRAWLEGQGAEVYRGIVTLPADLALTRGNWPGREVGADG